MKVAQIVFSPTGGTQQVADIITAAWGKPVDQVDLSDPGLDGSALNVSQEDVAVIAVPSYGGRVPALAAERLAKLNGNQAQCVLVCVYGNRAYEDTLIELSDLAEQSNFKVIAAVSAIAEHSIARQYAAGRPDQDDKNELGDFASKILKKVEACDTNTSALQIPGDRPYKKSGGGGMVPKADGKCVSCGLCAEKCPTQAISKEDIKSADSSKCISCMRCIALCPQSARKLNVAMASAVALALKKVCSERRENELFI